MSEDITEQPINQSGGKISRREFLRLSVLSAGAALLGASSGRSSPDAIPATPLPAPILPPAEILAPPVPPENTHVAERRLANYIALRNTGLFESYPAPPDPLGEKQLQEMLTSLSDKDNHLPVQLQGLVRATQRFLNGGTRLGKLPTH